MHLLNSLLKDPVLITLIVVIGGGCILGVIVNFVVHRQSVKFFAQNGATEGSNDATDNNNSPADQGSTARNRGAGDTNGNGVKRMVCAENTIGNEESPDDLSDSLYAYDSGGRKGIYEVTKEAAKLFIKNYEKGAYDNRPPEVKNFIDRIVATLSNWRWNEEKDVARVRTIKFLRVHVFMLHRLTHIGSLNEMDPDIWIEWLTLQSNKKRVQSNLEMIRDMAMSYLKQGRKIPYFYIMKATVAALDHTEVPDEIKNSFQVPKELKTQFSTFDTNWKSYKKWEDAIQLELHLQLAPTYNEMASAFEQGAYDDKNESVKSLIKELLDQCATGIMFSNKECYFDVISLLASLRDVRDLNEVDPILWINYLKWVNDEDLMRDIEKILNNAKDFQRQGNLEAYFYILYHCVTEFTEFRRKVPGKISEALLEQKSELKESFSKFVTVRCVYLGDTWQDFVPTPIAQK